MILYQSCVWTGRNNFRSRERKRTLTNKQQCNPENSKWVSPIRTGVLKQEPKALKKIQKQVSNRNEPKTVITVKLARVNLNQGYHKLWNSRSEFPIVCEANLFYLRVWSWLRMNAGGVLNTCKSNGDVMWAGSACTEQSFHILVADGWVTRG